MDSPLSSDEFPPIPAPSSGLDEFTPPSSPPSSRAEDSAHKNSNSNSDSIPPILTRLLAAYSSLSAPRLVELLAPEFQHRVLPASLGMPVRDRAAFGRHAAAVFGAFERFAMVPQGPGGVMRVVAAAGETCWVVHARMAGLLKGEGPDRDCGDEPWRNECVLFVRTAAGGAAVAAIDEFVDSAKAVEMMRRRAPQAFGAEEGVGDGRRSGAEVWPGPGVSIAATLCWFWVALAVATMGAPALAILIFWAHPALEARRREMFA